MHCILCPYPIHLGLESHPFVDGGVQIQEMRDPRAVTIPALERLAAILDGNDDMRTFFVEAGGCARLSQLAASDQDSIKGGLYKYNTSYKPDSIFSASQSTCCGVSIDNGYHYKDRVWFVTCVWRLQIWRLQR